MSYSVANGLSVTLIFGKAEFPLDANNRLKMMHIVESVQLQVPQLTLEIVDTTSFLEKLGLQDGMPISISLSQGGQIFQNLKFRLFSYKASRENYSMLYRISAYLDVPKYWLGLSQGVVRGTSAEALAKIASDCGLTYNGITTNDSQLWTSGCSKYYQWAKYIADRGYASTTSCMVLGITLLKYMIYTDIMNLPDPQVVLRALNTQADSEYLVNSYKVSASPGLGVSNGGYYTTRVTQSVVKDNYTDKIDKVEVKNNVNSPAINTTVRTLIGQKQIITYSPIDCGNASDMHENALYQNYRLKSLFTVNGDFIVSRPCPLTLCVPFNFYAVNSDGTTSEKDSGTYITCSRVLYINEGNYFEKIAASRIGTNAEYYAN